MSDHTPTFADLCSAIAEGHIAATRDGSMYQMTVFELRRYLNKFRSLPTISAALESATSPSSETNNWPTQTSVA